MQDIEGVVRAAKGLVVKVITENRRGSGLFAGRRSPLRFDADGPVRRRLPRVAPGSERGVRALSDGINRLGHSKKLIILFGRGVWGDGRKNEDMKIENRMGIDTPCDPPSSSHFL